jgi:hypothetical protein
MFGMFLSVSTYLIGRCEMDDHRAMVQLHLDRERLEIELSQPTVSAPKEFGTITRKLVLTKIDGATETQEEHTWKEGEQPTAEFIVECFKIAHASKDRKGNPIWRVTERAVDEKFPGYNWNDKLTIMERVGVLRKEDPAVSNSARIWQVGLFPGERQALEAFSYAPPALGSVAQNAPVGT